MSKNNIYQTYVANVISPSVNNSYSLPAFQGLFYVELLNSSRIRIGSNISGGLRVVSSVTESIINVVSYGDLFLTILNQTGVFRYVRIYFAQFTLSFMSPNIVEIDLEEDVVLDNESFVIALNQGVLSFSGDFA